MIRFKNSRYQIEDSLQGYRVYWLQVDVASRQLIGYTLKEVKRLASKVHREHKEA